MAKRNLRKAWLRHTVLLVVLALAIAGDVLLGLFFAGLEARAGALAPAMEQNTALVVLAPAGTNVEAWLSGSRYSSFVGGRNYDEAVTMAWSYGHSPLGRTVVLAVSFDQPVFRALELAGRWPFDAGEVALPLAMATALGVGPGDGLRLHIPGDETLQQGGTLRITGVFVPEVIGPDRGPRMPRTRSIDPTLSLPLVALRPGGGQSPRWPINAAMLTVRAADAKYLESRMRANYEREYPMQPAAQRFALVDPVFLRADLGPELGRSLGRLIFAPGRRALAASFLFAGVGIFVILLIAFIERKRELAVLKTVGMNNNMVLGMVLLELGAVALAALALGSAAAVIIGGAIAAAVEYMPRPTFWAWFWATAHTALVLFAATILPVSMMRLATVQQLLQNERLYIFRKRVTLS
jgi:hypothetical protein